MFGYHGVIALVDLAARKVQRIEIEEDLARKYIGGSGIGTYLLVKYGLPAMDPLDPGSPLIYMTGPFMGTGIPTSGGTRSSPVPAHGRLRRGRLRGEFRFPPEEIGFRRPRDNRPVPEPRGAGRQG